jgi:hypothetical protein
MLIIDFCALLTVAELIIDMFYFYPLSPPSPTARCPIASLDCMEEFTGHTHIDYGKLPIIRSTKNCGQESVNLFFRLKLNYSRNENFFVPFSPQVIRSAMEPIPRSVPPRPLLRAYATRTSAKADFVCRALVLALGQFSRRWCPTNRPRR